LLKNVGFLQYIKKDWLDATMAFYQNGQNIDEIKASLDKLIKYDVPKNEERRKTIDVLTRIWIRIPSKLDSLRLDALNFYDDLDPNERIILHWGMLLLAYPFFRDIVFSIGSLLKIQNNFTSTQLRNRLVSNWGHRTTIIRAMDRIIQSLKNWNILIIDDKSLKPNSKMMIKNESLCLWFLECVFRTENSDSMLFEKLISSQTMFPFELKIPVYKIKQAKNFEFQIHGMNIEMISLKKN
jgi:hypothetical protein